MPKQVLPAGLPWLMPRLKHAKALRIYTTYRTNESLTTTRPLNETARLLHSASSYVSKLSVLVRQLLDEKLGRPCCKPMCC